jgi:hypothetical protein
MHTTRGVTAQFCLVDESDFTPSAVKFDLVFPLLTIDEAVTLLISSQSDKQSSENDEFEHVADVTGETIFSYKRFALVCDACQIAGVRSADACPHMQHIRPEHQSARKLAQLEQLYKTRKDAFVRENLGLDESSHETWFEPDLVDHFFRTNNRIRINNEFYSTIYVAIDPCGGKKDPKKEGKSEYVMWSALPKHDDFLVLTGLDALQVSGKHDYAPHIIAHLKKVRTLGDGTRRARIIIEFENNSNMDASWLDDELKRAGITNYEWFGAKELKMGVGTDNAVKRNMAVLTRRMMQTGKIFIADESQFFTTMTKDWKGHPITAEDNLRKCREQLGRYKQIVEVGNDPTKPATITFSGKENGQQDDVAVALQLLCYHTKAHRDSLGAASAYGISTTSTNVRSLNTTHKP